ncbi:MAG: HTTM domain-containing protein, partial [Anaerolineae bacterium]|nr:HTTM domain-containing protein [Anaerolineae bacterium]
MSAALERSTASVSTSGDDARPAGWARLFAPTAIAPLVYFRLAFGLIMLWEIWRYFDHGWIARYYVEPTYFFGYAGFEWLKPLPGFWMVVFFCILALLALFVMAGLFYRWSAALFFLGFTYWFLLDQTHYLNHFYLISLISFLMIFVPAHRALSLDGLRRPGLQASAVPAWTIGLLR